jgi:uncharacterized protein with GYD domain
MPTFIVLSTLTDDGAETLVKNPERIKEVNGELERHFGVKVVAQYAVLGPYDFVNIVEAEDSLAVARAMLHLASRGSVKTTTLEAIPVADLIARLK